MIPKTIHYCWFGRNPKPKLANKCIKSWKEKCSGYKIVEWNEDSFDIAECPLYVRQAYEEKKWAFVTDYVRLKVVYDNGGLYFDTDVEVLKSFDNLLSHHSFFGFEKGKYVATGLGFGAEKGASILKELMKQYEHIPFLLPDGTADILPCPQRNIEVFEKNGLILNNSKQVLIDGTVVYPSDYFCPLSWRGKMNKTNNTMSIHWFSESWKDRDEEKRKRKQQRKQQHKKNKDILRHLPNALSKKMLGEYRYDRMKRKIKHVRNMHLKR